MSSREASGSGHSAGSSSLFGLARQLSPPPQQPAGADAPSAQVRVLTSFRLQLEGCERGCLIAHAVALVLHAMGHPSACAFKLGNELLVQLYCSGSQAILDLEALHADWGWAG